MLLLVLVLVLSLSNVLSLSCVKGKKDSFQYCEPSNQDKNICRCNNIKINGTGYSDCKSTYDGTPWCYVTKSSPCRDKKYSAQNEMIKATFGHAAPDIYFSDQACQQRIDFSSDELTTFLPGIELRGQEKETWIDAPTPEACEAECYARKSGCDAWTFFQSPNQRRRKNYAWNNDKNCRLKSGRICLNFLSSRRRNSRAISGFNCVDPVGFTLLPDLKIQCWATDNVLPDFCPVAGAIANGIEFTPATVRFTFSYSKRSF